MTGAGSATVFENRLQDAFKRKRHEETEVTRIRVTSH